MLVKKKNTKVVTFFVPVCSCSLGVLYLCVRELGLDLQAEERGTVQGISGRKGRGHS